MKVSELPRSELVRRLEIGEFLVRFGPFVLRLDSQDSGFAEQFQELYSENGVVAFDEEVADLTYQLRRSGLGLWVWLVNGAPTERAPFPAELILTHFEWAIHDSIAWALAPSLAFHAAVVADGTGRGIALVASSGSGKSTLAAGMVSEGWYLVADEFFVTAPSGQLMPMPGPITLKNESISVIRARGGPVLIGPSVQEPARGTLAHVRSTNPLPPDLSIRVEALIFPTFGQDQELQLSRVTAPHAFQQLMLQSQNLHLLGEPGFRLLSVVARIPAWSLHFSTLDDGIRAAITSLSAAE